MKRVFNIVAVASILTLSSVALVNPFTGALLYAQGRVNEAAPAEAARRAVPSEAIGKPLKRVRKPIREIKSNQASQTDNDKRMPPAEVQPGRKHVRQPPAVMRPSAPPSRATPVLPTGPVKRVTPQQVPAAIGERREGPTELEIPEVTKTRQTTQVIKNEVSLLAQEIDTLLKRNPRASLSGWEGAMDRASGLLGEAGQLNKDILVAGAKNLKLEDWRAIQRTIDVLRPDISRIRVMIESLREPLPDDTQLTASDLQQVLQNRQQAIQTLSNISKSLNDTTLAIIRNIQS
jgi:hypothetical protein